MKGDADAHLRRVFAVCHHSQDPFCFYSGGFRFTQRGKMQHPPPNRNTHTHFHSHTPTILFISLPSLCLLDFVRPVCRSDWRHCVRLDGLLENYTNGSLYRNIPAVFYCSLQQFLSTVAKLQWKPHFFIPSELFLKITLTIQIFFHTWILLENLFYDKNNGAEQQHHCQAP